MHVFLAGATGVLGRRILPLLVARGVCDDEPAPARTWVPAFCRAVGAPPPAAAAGPAPRTGWARGADNHRARALGWTPRYPSWRDGFAALRHTRVTDTRQGEIA